MHQLGKHPRHADVKQPICELVFETEDVAEALKQAVVAGASLVKEPELLP